MEAEKKVKKKGGRRKSAPPRVRNGSNGPASQKLKELWADPRWANAQRKKSWEAQLKRTDNYRLNVPDGMRKGWAERLWRTAQLSAKRTIEAMTKNGVFEGEEDPRAKEALEFAITTMRGKHDIRARLAAASKVLEYTKSKPVAKSEVTVNKAEEWLAAVSVQADDEQDQTDEIAGDAEASS